MCVYMCIIITIIFLMYLCGYGHVVWVCWVDNVYLELQSVAAN